MFTKSKQEIPVKNGAGESKLAELTLSDAGIFELKVGDESLHFRQGHLQQAIHELVSARTKPHPRPAPTE